MTEKDEKTEQEIADFLEENGPSILGEVLRALKLSYSNGTKHINNMLTKGIVKQSAQPLQLELNSDRL
jgi:DNA-binding MarR family transcriptional regulator